MTQNLWFTADQHFGHEKILKMCSRPFGSIEEHDACLVQNWNRVVRPKDKVFILGDFALCNQDSANNIAKRLNGTLCLIRGNHDKKIGQISRSFEWVKDYYELSTPKHLDDKQKIVLFHYAMRVWNGCHRGSWHLYGHSHGKLGEDINGLAMDVGVDAVANNLRDASGRSDTVATDYRPISYHEIKSIMEVRNKNKMDRNHD